MDRYEVLCDCAGGEAVRVATILDGRANGGQVSVIPDGSKAYTIEFDRQRNRRGMGDTAPIDIRCASCNRGVSVTFLTVRDIVDSIADKEALSVAQLPAPEDAPWLGGLIEAVGGNDHRVIPLRALCYAVTKLKR